jgi:hypothetical protein
MGQMKAGKTEKPLRKLKTNLKLILKGKRAEVLKASEGTEPFHEMNLVH